MALGNKHKNKQLLDNYLTEKNENTWRGMQHYQKPSILIR